MATHELTTRSPEAMGDVGNGAVAERLSYSVPDFAAAVGVSRSEIYEQISAGHLISRKVGRRRIIVRDEGVEWLKKLPKGLPSGTG
jgi:excisionase family DNA binding protein